MDLINTLGGSSGFGENVVARADDGPSVRVDLSSVFTNGLNFGSTNYSEVYLNMNGNVTFGSSFQTYSPYDLSYVSRDGLFPFWADINTRTDQVAPSPGGTSLGTNLVYYDLDEVNGVFTVTWDDVRPYGSSHSEANAFQLELRDVSDELGRSAGDFEFTFRYEAVNWTSGGNNFSPYSLPRVGVASDTAFDGSFDFPGLDTIAGLLALPETDPLSGISTNAGITPYLGDPIATMGDDLLYGSTLGSLVDGLGGNDTLKGLSANDTLLGNTGDDLLQGAAGRDELRGGEGEDTLLGEDGHDLLHGQGGGANRLVGGLGNDRYLVDTQNDQIIEQSGQGLDGVYAAAHYGLDPSVSIELLRTRYNDGMAPINLSGNDADQRIVGNAGANTLRGGLGDDTLDGGAGADLLVGGLGHDVYVLDSMDSLVEADREGIDTVLSRGSNTLDEGASIEVLRTIYNRGQGNIDLVGNDESQLIRGNLGDNLLRGLGGDDTLVGGGGNDVLIGDAGADIFVFDRAPIAGQHATIEDYVVADDQMLLRASAFDDLFATADNTLAAFAFRANLSGLAQDGNDRIIYDQSTGALWFDEDGSGSAAAIQFAELSAGLALTASEFEVI